MPNFFAALITLLLIPSVSFGQELKLVPAGDGHNFIYEQDSKALASNLQIVFRSGHLSDPKGKEGLASVAFQSLLRGTQKRDRKSFFAAIERLGADISVDVASNRTILTLNVISENLEEAIKLLAEAVLSPALKDSEIRSLITEELAQRNSELSNNRSILRRVFRQAVFTGTPLAFPASGTIDGLRAIKPEDVREFLKAHIKSGNLVVASVSNHGEKEVMGWAEASLRNIPAGLAPEPSSPKPDPGKGRRLFLVDRKGSSTTEVAIGHLGITADRKDREVLETGLFILGGDMSSRLFQILRGKNGWTYGASSSFQSLEIPRRHGGSFMIYTFPQAEHTERATLEALKIYEDFVKNGATAKELSFAKKSQVNSYPFRFATSRSRLTARLYQYLDGAAVPTVEQYRKEVNGISRASLRKSIQGAMTSDNLVIVLVGDPDQTASLAKSIPNITEVKKVEDPMKPF